MESFGERLEQAIKRFGPRPPSRPGSEGSVKQFHEMLRKRVATGGGASYQTLWRIIGGVAEPSEEFVNAALDVLPQVRREWLETGEEPVTRIELAVEAEIEDNSEPLPSGDMMRDAFANVFPFDSLSAAARGQVWRLWIAVTEEYARGVGDAAALSVVADDLAERIARALDAPLRELRVAPNGRARDSYIIGVCEALLTVWISVEHGMATITSLERENNG